MSCGTAMHNAGMHEGAGGAMQAEGTAKFHADLLNGLHAVAQPLTVLRAAIEILSRPAGAAIDHQRYLEISASQVARTCDLFSCIRELVTSTLLEARRGKFDLWEALEPKIEDHRSNLQSSGVGVVVMRSDAWGPVFGDAERAEQAFCAVLKTAAGLASRGDVIEVRTSCSKGFAELTLLNTRGHGRQLNASERLNLSLAEVSIFSQQGRCRFTEDPFSFSFALPVQDAGPLAAAKTQPVH